VSTLFEIDRVALKLQVNSSMENAAGGLSGTARPSYGGSKPAVTADSIAARRAVEEVVKFMVASREGS
jgi:hypothetical protein